LQIPEWIELFLFLTVLLVLIPPIGIYIAKIFSDTPPFFKVIGKIESLLYFCCQIDPKKEMDWQTYCKNLLVFNASGLLVLILIQLLQHLLPLNPQNLGGVEPFLAVNTAVSFMTNTNWQAYSGEVTMSYFTQMIGLTVQNFLSASTGLATLITFIRGIRKSDGTGSLGNFWQDLTRGVLYLLLPLSIALAFLLVNEGVPETLAPYVQLKTLEGADQTIPLGNIASQVAIKQLGTNGGGFFGVNSAHPLENPSLLSNFFQTLSLVLIPGALCYTYGLMTGFQRHSHILLLSMFLLLAAGFSLGLFFEESGNPITAVKPFLEGKETRFGVYGTTLWTALTTASANGSVNGMIESLTPALSGIALFNMMTGELIFGGIGVGLSSMLMFVLLTVFLSGLMVGRTPEYLGKKIEKKEVQLVIASILLPGIVILFGSSLSLLLPSALSSIGNHGPHGLSEILYAFSSATLNNGSSFAGLNANTAYFNTALAVCMLFGRALIIVPTLALAGSFALKRKKAQTSGTFSTDSFLFLALLLGTILIVGAMTFFPALALGPVIEQYLMQLAKTFS